jgi:hypothetical protein
MRRRADKDPVVPPVDAENEGFEIERLASLWPSEGKNSWLREIGVPDELKAPLSSLNRAGAGQCLDATFISASRHGGRYMDRSPIWSPGAGGHDMTYSDPPGRVLVDRENLHADASGPEGWRARLSQESGCLPHIACRFFSELGGEHSSAVSNLIMETVADDWAVWTAAGQPYPTDAFQTQFMMAFLASRDISFRHEDDRFETTVDRLKLRETARRMWACFALRMRNSSAWRYVQVFRHFDRAFVESWPMPGDITYRRSVGTAALDFNEMRGRGEIPRYPALPNPSSHPGPRSHGMSDLTLEQILRVTKIKSRQAFAAEAALLDVPVEIVHFACSAPYDYGPWWLRGVKYFYDLWCEDDRPEIESGETLDSFICHGLRLFLEGRRSDDEDRWLEGLQDQVDVIMEFAWYIQSEGAETCFGFMFRHHSGLAPPAAAAVDSEHLLARLKDAEKKYLREWKPGGPEYA